MSSSSAKSSKNSCLKPFIEVEPDDVQKKYDVTRQFGGHERKKYCLSHVCVTESSTKIGDTVLLIDLKKLNLKIKIQH